MSFAQRRAATGKTRDVAPARAQVRTCAMAGAGPATNGHVPTQAVDAREQFSKFFEYWIAEQDRDLQSLRSAVAGEPAAVEDEAELRGLVDRVLGHYEYYYRAKAAAAREDVLSMFSPAWTSSTENLFLWVGGWRPTMAIQLLYSKSGIQLDSRLDEILNGDPVSDLAGLTHDQLERIDRLHRRTVRLENEVSDEEALAQEKVADEEMVELSHAISADGAGVDLMGPAMGRKEAELETVLGRADRLRLDTLRAVVNILRPVQAVHFLIAAAELHLRVHEFGKAKDARAGGNGSDSSKNLHIFRRAGSSRVDGMATYRFCFCFRRRFRAASEEPPEGIKKVFEQYSAGGVMGLEHLQRFMVEVQGDVDGAAATSEAAQAVFRAATEWRHLRLLHRKGLYVEHFFHYLFSNDNGPLARTVYQDMNAPLSRYFIYTGHNSYLTGNQLSSACSDVPIIKALQRGVRVIELDLWPNAAKDDVEVLHGRTLTTPVDLPKCLRAIREYAFVASPYPVIVTLEDHLTPNLQAKVAQMLTETFGRMMFIPDSESSEEFPSPEELKKRIIVSTKPPKEYLETKIIKEKDQEDHKATEGEEEWGGEFSDLKSLHHEDTEHFQEEEDLEVDDPSSHSMVVPEYKRLIAIAAKKRSAHISESLKVDPHNVTRLSLNEQAFEKAASSHASELIRFTQRNLLRIFPKNTRVTSSNYNPMLGWMHGAQMVALNMQGHGRPLWLMHGMFKANGGCGYVKKPDILLNKDSNHVFDPRATMKVKKTLKVKVYSGDGWRFDFSQSHFDIYSPPDFYTKVGIAGVPADSVMYKTRTIEDDWTPVWDEEFVFPLTFPELALLRIEVHEYDTSKKDDFAGQTCLPVWELRPGIRSVRLCDSKGEILKSVKLLMSFEFS